MFNSDYMRREQMLTIQQAAHQVLKEAGISLKSVEVARRIHEQQLVQSAATNPIQSISQALERNIRMNKGNTPKLNFTETAFGREITIPPSELASMLPATSTISYEQKESITVELPKNVVDKIKIFQLGTGLDTLDEAVALLVRSGLVNNSSKLLESIKKEMEEL